MKCHKKIDREVFLHFVVITIPARYKLFTLTCFKSECFFYSCSQILLFSGFSYLPVPFAEPNSIAVGPMSRSFCLLFFSVVTKFKDRLYYYYYSHLENICNNIGNAEYFIYWKCYGRETMKFLHQLAISQTRSKEDTNLKATLKKRDFFRRLQQERIRGCKNIL